MEGHSGSLFRASLHVIIILLGSCCMNLLHSAASGTNKLGGGNETDRLALLEFKAGITTDPFRVFTSWNDSIHFCLWYGVTCGHRHQRVTVLDLQSRKLVGSISPHIGNLSFLRNLHLQNNSFSHEIPSELGRLKRLQALRLNNNSLGGEIPANISSCSNLIGFDVVYNRLVGKIPSELAFLPSLRFLLIGYNNLSGSIPSSLGNLSHLQILFANINNFGGFIPNALGQLKNLYDFALGGNMLSGTIPPSIFNLTFIESIDVTGNRIRGSLPSDIGITLPDVQFLGIGINQFTGSIPGSISNASNLDTLIVAANKLTGRVPTMENLHWLSRLSIAENHLGNGVADDLSFLSSLRNATNLEALSLNDNNFGGVLPNSLGNLSTKLVYLYLDNNQISGGIPMGIGNLINLEGLSFLGNQITGNIPIDFGKLQNLKELDLSLNKISGKIPLSLGNLSMLTILVLYGNLLEGSIPSSLGEYQSLLQLDLSQNNLSGTIPPQVIGLSSLALLLDLSQNHLTGSLPVEVGKLGNLNALDVSENMLSGEIPSTLGDCVQLEFLSTADNFFHGIIPSSLASLKSLKSLDLSHNNLSGEIPKYLGDLDLLQNLNLSFNDFEGMVPTEGVFKNATAVSVIGNSKLCGGVLQIHLPRCNFKRSKKSGLSIALKVIIPTICGLLGLSLVLCYLFLYGFKRTRKEPPSRSSANSFREVSYKSLLKATNGFSSSNLIGVGSFGSVYKGILDQDEIVIAVKVLNLQHRGGSKSFLVECEVLRNIRHRNIIKVLTACSGVDYQGNDFKALIYEFMANGSLDEWLHPCGREEGSPEEPRNLCFLQRLNIAIDVACALDYLHHHCQTPIVHCDLKPSNVLLDDEMTGHVGDFGLARFLANNFSSTQSSSIGVRGSLGYTAPEYGMGSELSTYGDVYSFGILLLEMFTGKRPTDETLGDSLNLHNFAKLALPERVMEIADPTLLKHQEIQECLISIFRLAIGCSTELPRERLDISDVVVELNKARDILVEASGRHGGTIPTITVES